MALTIRLRKQGRNNHQTFRLVVTDRRNPRDGKYLEMLGWYDPALPNDKNLSIKGERVDFWVKQGAQLSENVKTLLNRAAPNVLKEWKEKVGMKRAKAAARRRGRKKTGAV